MKIALISSNKDGLLDAARTLEAESHSIIAVEGSNGRIRAIAEQEQPDLLLIEVQHPCTEVLSQVEYITMQYPGMAVILLSANQTPAFLLEAMRAGVREVLPLLVAPVALMTAVSRVAAKLTGGQSKSAAKILAFMSCKGGSGATFLATNLGYQLAETRKVLLIDLNLQFGDALSFLHDGTPLSTIANIAQDIRRLDASFLAACTVRITDNYSVLAAPEDPSDAVKVKPAHIDSILNLAAAQYDFVVIDMARAIDPVSIRALDHAYRVFPVLQAGLPYVRNAKKLMDIFTALGYPKEKTELIVNRFEKRSEIGIEDIRRLVGSACIHTVPNSYKDVIASINQGDPLIKVARSNTVSRILSDFTNALNPRQEATRGFFGKLLRRA
ncbi:AAA family ATPase [Noviherbaspirillum sp. CPCC 100848]|uniref:AAA family ATPase n=1 Tax=Noviherbaspirillum album TaxID=3080276 RepID=A0ABU6JJ81_9BURK|nr:AAA family ATPase [Noviherbaspirillum sp. CPCC 100848]MEC4723325.1 AAA family ATPase [Noviherbaspirillum sp. CPCC 100848]